MGYIDSVAAAVQGLTKDWREQAAMLMACGAESGCTPVQNRQGAPAYGPWQIYLPYHPGVSIDQANNPQFAASYMYNKMNVSGCTAKQQNWETNPQAAAVAAARCIEGATPLEPYSQAQIQQGWAIVTQNAPPPGSQAPGTQPLSFPNPAAIARGIIGANAGNIPGGVNAITGGLAGRAGSAAASGVTGWVVDLVKSFIGGEWPQRVLLIGTGWIIALMGVSALVKAETGASPASIAAAAA